MPTYEYRCTACNTEFEKFQRMSDEPGAECPKCGSPSEAEGGDSGKSSGSSSPPSTSSDSKKSE